jgi:4'-phosphopantetheinyl transferase
MQHVSPQPDWLEPQLAQRLAGMSYTKRREEARLGRWTAKMAIARRVGIDPTPRNLRNIEVRNAPDGAPEAHVDGAPLDGVIAMTDRADWAVCAIVQGSGRVGCDLELVEPRSGAFVRDYLTAPERDCVAASADPDATANLIWSAKESALKVLRTGLRRDTRSVTVRLGDHDPSGWDRLSVDADDGRVFSGWWARFNRFLLTMVTEEETPPPVSLEVPEPLRTAVPGHSWMDQPYTPLKPD